MEPLAFIGGTGPEGLGLAMRLAAAGEPVLIGSRDPARAQAAAERVRAAVPGAQVAAATNDEALASSNRIACTLPFAALPPFLASSAPRLGGKLVIDVIVPLAMEAGTFVPAPVPGAPSVGELIQQAAPGARVVSAFKNVAAKLLANLAVPLTGDVLLCGNDEDARTAVAALVARLPRLRAVDAGPLANARALEALTALLRNLNRRYRANTSIAIVGLP